MQICDEGGQLPLPVELPFEPRWLSKMTNSTIPGIPLNARSPGGVGRRDFAGLALEILGKLEIDFSNLKLEDVVVEHEAPPLQAVA
jgi:hypothetical protein